MFHRLCFTSYACIVVAITNQRLSAEYSFSLGMHVASCIYYARFLTGHLTNMSTIYFKFPVKNLATVATATMQHVVANLYTV